MNLFWVLSNRHNNTTGSFLGCLIEQIKSAWLYMLMGKYTLVLLSKCVAQWLMVLNISDQTVSNSRSIMLNKFRISYFYICCLYRSTILGCTRRTVCILLFLVMSMLCTSSHCGFLNFSIIENKIYSGNMTPSMSIINVCVWN